MFSDDVVISVNNLTKTYRIFDNPLHRISQKFVFGKAKYYREFTALDNASFEIRKGETVGIIGRNGSGKSTLLQLVCSILKPSSGEIHVRGRVAALLELGAGFHPEFTGRENVFMQGAILGFSREEMAQRFASITAFADIGESIDQPVKYYSSGMFVRLAFAIMVHLDADVLVIDEALSVGDAAFTQKCMRYLHQFRQHGTLILVSHDLASITALCDRAVWLDHGQIRSMGTTKEVCDTYLGSVLGIPEDVERSAELDDECLSDQRRELMNASTLRNDLKLFRFDITAESAGSGLARIIDVRMESDEGKPYGWIVGGELVTLVVRAKALAQMASPILGFLVKDRLGQSLLGDNTYLSYVDRSLSVSTGTLLEARFRFRMPRLPIGDYSICAAVADGSQSSHITHHWIHDALTFRSHRSSVGQALVGLPMLDITLTASDDNGTTH
jgi:lipopolysaccharide transport system ATP-binding protein